MKKSYPSENPWDDLKLMENGIIKDHRIFWSDPENNKKIHKANFLNHDNS